MKKTIVSKLVLLSIIFGLSSLTLTDCKKTEVAVKPVISTSAIFNIAATTATAGGFVSSDGGADVTLYGVCWGANANPALTDSKTSDGNGTGQFISSLSGLTAGTTYHVRAYAINYVGISYGSDITFATLGQSPTGLTQPASNISITGATLNGILNPNNISTAVSFEYGLTTSYGQTATAAQNPITGNNLTIVSADITGLIQGTIYHFRVKSVNSIGTVTGNDLYFTTLGQSPAAVTLPATNITPTTATFNGAVNPNSVSTAVSFEYGTTTSYGQASTATQSPLSGGSIMNVSKDITGLTPGTIYNFRVKTVNSIGTIYSGNMQFTTLGQIPSASTLPASGITNAGATLNGIVNPNYLSTAISFEYGLTTSYGQTVIADQSPVLSNIMANVTARISGLIADTTYHFRVKTVNSLGTTLGSDFILKTLSNTISSSPTVVISNYDDIYSCSIDGSKVTQLTSGSAIDANPRINFSRNSIAFNSNRTGRWEVFTMNIDGSNIQQITTSGVSGGQNNGGHGGLDWTPDGKILFTKGTKIYKMNSDGTGITEIATAPSNYWSDLRCSPNGDKIIAQTQGSWGYTLTLYSMNIDGSNISVFAPDLAGSQFLACFSLDGLSFLYTYDLSGHEESSGQSYNDHIISKKLDGSSSTDLSTNKISGSNDIKAVYTPTGTKILFTNNVVSTSNPQYLWIMNSDGSNRVLILNSMNVYYVDCK